MATSNENDGAGCLVVILVILALVIGWLFSDWKGRIETRLDVLEKRDK